ncbi:hypothetical protein QWZ03_20270 [Chitinimonas viridis]|uniref:Uncharacterized protein n=1 Tax=Chitinimonas viridis TaxID=664880 RepID=A0ABT8BBH6_9NEIS|nr:hypothetical protein [Chitinimonas viridis]MDN3579110.1 hypothetical protein [Chitinimonas viridis]
MKIKLKVPKPRNPIALAASQRGGGGVHDKAEKTRRRDSRQALRQALKQGRDDVPPFFTFDVTGSVSVIKDGQLPPFRGCQSRVRRLW